MIVIASIIGVWFICAVAAERAAEAITTSVFFSPLRQYLARVAISDGTEPRSTIWKSICRWLSELVSCGWCTSFWTSLFFSFFLPGGYISLNGADNLIVKVVALWGFANSFHSVFRLVHNGRVEAVDLNVRLINSDVNNYGGIDGELGQGISQESASGIEPTEV